MAQAIKTVMTYNLDGATKDFNIPFEYLARKFVVATLIGVDRKVLILNQDYRFSTRTTLSTTVAWGQAQGYTQIEIRRYTSATERLVDFTDGSILRAYDLNVSQVQTLHVAEEARDLTADTIGVNNDGHLDARGRRIVNLANAVEDRDAVPLGQLKGMNQNAWDARNQAEAFKNQAQGFRNEAEVSRNAAEDAKARAGASELKAKDWAVKMNGAVEGDSYSSKYYSTLTASDRTASAQSRDAAQQAQRSAEQAQASASNSQISASTSANTAKQEADRAKGYADAFGNTLDIGKVVSSMNTTTNAVEWKGAHYTTNFVGSKSTTSNLGLETEGGRAQVVVNGSGGGWRYFPFPSEGGVIATREWVNGMVYLPNSSVTRVKSPNGSYVLQMENGGIYGFKDTVKDIYTFAFKSGEPHFYDTSAIYVHGRNDWPGFSLYRTNGSHLRLEANPESSTVLFNIVGRNASGQNTHGFAIPTGYGTAATREWSNGQYVKKSPTSRTIWTGEFGSSNRTITLSESIIGKVIAVRAYDRDRWETIHILWAGSWATGAGSSTNMFTVSANGKTLTCGYEAENGRWREIRVVE